MELLFLILAPVRADNSTRFLINLLHDASLDSTLFSPESFGFTTLDGAYLKGQREYNLIKYEKGSK